MTTNHDLDTKQITTAVHATAEQLPVRPVPLSEILRGGQRRRRARVIAAGAVVAVAVPSVLVAALTLPGAFPSNRPTPPSVAASDGPSSTDLALPCKQQIHTELDDLKNVREQFSTSLEAVTNWIARFSDPLVPGMTDPQFIAGPGDGAVVVLGDDGTAVLHVQTQRDHSTGKWKISGFTQCSQANQAP